MVYLLYIPVEAFQGRGTCQANLSSDVLLADLLLATKRYTPRTAGVGAGPLTAQWMHKPNRTTN